MAAYSERKIAVYEAKLAMETKRYDDAVDALKRVAKLGLELTAEERDLLEQGYCNMIKSKCAVLKILSSIQLRSKDDKFKTFQNYRYIKKVGDELVASCNDVKTMVLEDVIPLATSLEDKIFYHNMVADHLRLGAEEIKMEPSMRRSLGHMSSDIYERATQLVDEKELDPADPIRLSLVLKRLELHQELSYNLSMECEIAQRAYDRATSTLNGEGFAKSNNILMELKENISKCKGSVLKLDMPSMVCFGSYIASCEDDNLVEFRPNAVISNTVDDDIVPRVQNASNKDGGQGAASL